MHPSIIGKPALKTGSSDNGQPREGPTNDDDEEEQALDLPVTPDEGTTLIPDDERVVNAPS